MTIEESIKNDPTKFQAALEATSPDVKKAMDELFIKLDEIFGKAIKDYCASEHVEANIDDIPTYKTMNKLITEKLDVLIGEHIKEKRKNL
ncbi:MAG: hypothetical protein J6P79_07415 [Pseudobutyrivibrio sp.]|nr:hypothetical protein [Pseudobutyrivibrio sp.]